ncbi:MAG: penicillin acylase family protein, partial [Taibaiella sp.]|nr:penicillin acylase family protein [Taibaiella sp.]
LDTVDYTLHGPVIYDDSFEEPNGIKQPLALRWMAHMESNELLSLYLLNRAKGYKEFTQAIQYFLCPAQNFIYADVEGNIALWGQGQYVNKWKEQGKYVMQGYDSTTLWGALIPVSENPHVLNPQQGYLSSANQNVCDGDYCYWFNGDFNELRAWRINEVLDTMHKATVKDMFRLQNDEHSILARKLIPYLLNVLAAKNIDDNYTQLLQRWNYNYTAKSEAATVFQVWWSILYNSLWQEKFVSFPKGIMYPLPERTMQLLLHDRSRLGNVEAVIISSYKKAADSLDKLKQQSGLEWYKVKNTSITHLAKLKPFSIEGVQNGGWGNTVNAMKGNHGPSWRMVVEMNDTPVGYGVYPGGQSGNPGSKYYSTFIDK